MKINQYTSYGLTELNHIESQNTSGGTWISYGLGWLKELAIVAGEAIEDAACAVGRVCSESINSLPLNHL